MCGSRKRMRSRHGFTLIELLIVITIAGVVITAGTLAFSGYFQRDSARRAAQVFAQDLTAARNYALRINGPVVIRFYEGSLWYEVVSPEDSTEIARRRFGANGDIELSGLTLDLSGDTLLFDSRGMVDVSPWGSSIATATFSAGEITYRVSFNGWVPRGSSRVERGASAVQLRGPAQSWLHLDRGPRSPRHLLGRHPHGDAGRQRAHRADAQRRSAFGNRGVGECVVGQPRVDASGFAHGRYPRWTR